MAAMDNDSNCKLYQDMLVLDHYGELEPEDAGRLASHLASCAACRDESNELARTLDAVPAYAPTQVEMLKALDGVMAKITRRRPAVLGRLFVPAMVAAGVVAVAAALAFHFSPAFFKGQPALQVIVAQADWDTLNNLDVLPDIDVIEDMDTIDQIEQM